MNDKTTLLLLSFLVFDNDDNDDNDDDDDAIMQNNTLIIGTIMRWLLSRSIVIGIDVRLHDNACRIFIVTIIF